MGHGFLHGHADVTVCLQQTACLSWTRLFFTLLRLPTTQFVAGERLRFFFTYHAPHYLVQPVCQRFIWTTPCWLDVTPIPITCEQGCLAYTWRFTWLHAQLPGVLPARRFHAATAYFEQRLYTGNRDTPYGSCNQQRTAAGASTFTTVIPGPPHLRAQAGQLNNMTGCRRVYRRFSGSRFATYATFALPLMPHAHRTGRQRTCAVYGCTRFRYRSLV